MFQNINHKFSPNLAIIGYWKVGDFFGETPFTEFGENIRDSLHLVTKNVQNFVKNTWAKIVIFWVEIFSLNMVKMSVIHLNW